MQWSIKSRLDRQAEKERRKRTWHKWWAWRPVVIDETIYWFEEIYRAKSDYDTWRYRTLMDFLKAEDLRSNVSGTETYTFPNYPITPKTTKVKVLPKGKNLTP
mgnify:CR=1 FL=1